MRTVRKVWCRNLCYIKIIARSPVGTLVWRIFQIEPGFVASRTESTVMSNYKHTRLFDFCNSFCSNLRLLFRNFKFISIQYLFIAIYFVASDICYRGQSYACLLSLFLKRIALVLECKTILDIYLGQVFIVLKKKKSQSSQTDLL